LVMQRYQVVKNREQGGFGLVCECIDKIKNKKLIIKIVSYSHSDIFRCPIDPIIGFKRKLMCSEKFRKKESTS
jgi:serine/threonine protein kinase